MVTMTSRGCWSVMVTGAAATSVTQNTQSRPRTATRLIAAYPRRTRSVVSARLDTAADRKLPAARLLDEREGDADVRRQLGGFALGAPGAEASEALAELRIRRPGDSDL